MLLLTKERWEAQAGQGFGSDGKVKASKGDGLCFTVSQWFPGVCSFPPVLSTVP